MNNVPLSWVVAYWEDSQVVFRGSGEFEWADLPTEDVLWVDVRDGGFHHRLSGFDNYWVHDDAFGVFNDPENWGWYGGDPKRQAFAWEWTGVGSRTVRPGVPDGARVLRGVLVPDEVAWELGLMPHGERLPPRPGGA